MLLTLYYMAATWLQTWKLSGIRSKISHIRKHHGSLLLYKDATTSNNPECSSLHNGGIPLVKNLGLQSCSNRKEAKIGDLIWFVPNKFGLSLFPKQILDVSDWIGVPGKKTFLPLELTGTRTSSLSESNVLYFVVEADFNTIFSSSHTHHCQVEDFGIACAWKAGDFLSLLVESDEEHLANLTSSFLSNDISIGPGLEITLVQSVEIKGSPCFLLNADSIPNLHSSNFRNRHLTSVRNSWLNHISLLKSFTQAATQAAGKSEPTPVNGNWAAILMPGGQDNPELNIDQEINLNSNTKPLELANTMEFNSPVIKKFLLLKKASSTKESTISSPMVEDLPSVSKSKECSVSSPLEEDPPMKSQVKCARETNLPKQISEDNDVSVSMTSLSPQMGSGEEVSMISSFDSLSRLSGDTLLATSPQSRTARLGGSSGGSLMSLRSMSTASKLSSAGKPPNILIFSESAVSVDSVKSALAKTLQRDRYTVYSLNLPDMLSAPWLDQSTLVIICGNVPVPLTPLLIQYLLHSGGTLLCLCSDLLGTLLPMFHTAEVKPDQLVTFSYSKWNNVKMMHNIFCYQAPPTSAKFSSSEEQNSSGIPEEIEVMDKDNKAHSLSVKVLGVEETWHTPSLMVAQANSSGGKVVFSQVHLEADPTQFENNEDKKQTLNKSNQVRLEILSDILSTHLGLHCCTTMPDFKYTSAYFLGTHELKQKLMDKLKPRLEGDVLKLQNISLKFCGKGVEPPEATVNFLPVLMYLCPESFNPVTYFETLQTKELGRLVIYSEVLTTSMHLIQGPPIAHGLAVIPCRQTNGVGRGENMWLSPDGCAMFSMQLHIPTSSLLGERLPFVQHIVSLAVVHSISKLPGLEKLELSLKWPNDIYAKSIKLGGLIINSIIINKVVILNVGCGFNLNNKYPTACINSMIEEFNKQHNKNIPQLSFEKYFALVFTELETLLDLVNAGKQEEVIKLYYKYWLHGGSEVDVKDSEGTVKRVTITGINEYGFLKVKGEEGEFSVQPDGNSFDMMAGLIAPKMKA